MDIDITQDGDLVVDSTGDLALSEGIERLKDDIIVRLKTQNPDWFHHPYIGANLDDFVGEPNTNATADKIKTNIIRSLVDSGVVPAPNLHVNALPVSKDEVVFVIIISRLGEVVKIGLRFNLETGVEEVI